MALIGNPNGIFSTELYELTGSDFATPSSFNPQYQALITNDAILDRRLDEYDAAGIMTLPGRVAALEAINADTRLTIIESQNLNGRVTNLEVRASNIEAQISSLQGQIGVPIGGVVAWAGDSGNIPSGFLLCNGQAYARNVYLSLFAVIGTRFSQPGDGDTVFRVPNLIDRFIMGTDSQFGLTGGSNSVTLSIANLPAHTHPGQTKAPPNSPIETDNLSINRGTMDLDAGAHTHFLAGGNESGGTNYYGPQLIQLANLDNFAGGTGMPTAPTDSSNMFIATPPNAIRGYVVRGEGSEHRHTFVTDAIGGDTPFDNRPQFMALAYIIRAI